MNIWNDLLDEVKKIRDNESIQQALVEQGLGSAGKDQNIDANLIQNIPPKILFENFVLISLSFNFISY